MVKGWPKGPPLCRWILPCRLFGTYRRSPLADREGGSQPLRHLPFSLGHELQMRPAPIRRIAAACNEPPGLDPRQLPQRRAGRNVCGNARVRDRDLLALVHAGEQIEQKIPGGIGEQVSGKGSVPLPPAAKVVPGGRGQLAPAVCRGGCHLGCVPAPCPRCFDFAIDLREPLCERSSHFRKIVQGCRARGAGWRRRLARAWAA